MASMKLDPGKKISPKLLGVVQALTRNKPPPASTSFVGQTAVVTGSNVGIGLETCRQMLDRGLLHLIMGTRSMDKGEAAANALRSSYTTAKIEVWPLDMLSYESIETFANRCAGLRHIDIVILNAGVLLTEFKLSSTGHEENIQVNYLSTALLSILLLPIMKSQSSTGHPGRLTIVSSNAGLQARFTNRNEVPLIASFDDPRFFGSFLERYTVSKMLLFMLTHRLSGLVSSENIIVNTVDPGLVGGTSLHRGLSGIMGMVMNGIKRLTARSLEAGAWTCIDAVATKGKESHGGLLVNWELYPFHEMMYTPEGNEVMERLWEETLEEIGHARIAESLRTL